MTIISTLLTRQALGEISLSSTRSEIIKAWGEAPLQSYPPHTPITIWKYGDLELWFEQVESAHPTAFFLKRSSFDKIVDFRLPQAEGVTFAFSPLTLEDCLMEVEKAGYKCEKSSIVNLTEVVVLSAKLKLRFDEANALYNVYQESKPWFHSWK